MIKETRSGESRVEPQLPFANENAATNENSQLRQPGAISRKLISAVAWVQRQNLASAVFGNPGIYDVRDFPWAADLERNWMVMRGELARVMMRGDVSPDSRTLDSATPGPDRSWTTLVLASYFAKDESNIAQFPETWRLVGKIPGLVSVMFSILEPGKRLPLHRGPYNGVLRFHLGLIIPEPQDKLGIRVGEDICRWEEGRALIFDDTVAHEAWNDTKHTRVVLFVDFARPLRWPARMLNWLVLHTFVFAPLVREGAENQGGWMRWLYRDAQIMQKITERDALADAVAKPDASTMAKGMTASAASPTAGEGAAAGSTPKREWPFDV